MSDKTYTIGQRDAHGHTCGCQEHDATVPELDAREIPHAIRHGAILGALGQLQPGAALVLVAPHNPLPLLAQIDQAWPGGFAREYVQEGDESNGGAWKLKFTRQ